MRLATKARLGVVEPVNSGVYFTHTDIDQCRLFLRSHGLNYGQYGWKSSDGTLTGILCYDGLIDRNGQPLGEPTWTAAYFR